MKRRHPGAHLLVETTQKSAYEEKMFGWLTKKRLDADLDVIVGNQMQV